MPVGSPVCCSRTHHGPHAVHPLAHSPGQSNLGEYRSPKPVSLRHGTPDPRLLVEIALAAVITDIEGGGICYCIPYSENFPLDRAILYWQYVDRVCAVHSRPGFEKMRAGLIGDNLEVKFENFENSDHVTSLVPSIYNGLQFIFQDWAVWDSLYNDINFDHTKISE